MTASAGILCLNAGSSSLKFAWFEVRDGGLDERARFHGQVEGIGSERARWVVHEVPGEVSDGMGASSPGSSPNSATGTSAAATQAALALTGSLEAQHEAALAQVLAWLEARLGQAQPLAVAHRVVHGGTEYAAPVVLDEGVLAQLEALVPLAPLHQPHNLRPIRWLKQRHPGWRQVACFDTAFHRTQPWQAQMMPLPRALWDAGVRRYGFHGLSYQFVASRLPEVLGERLAQGRVVIAHLGVDVCARCGAQCRLDDGFYRAGRFDDGHALWRDRSGGGAAPIGAGDERGAGRTVAVQRVRAVGRVGDRFGHARVAREPRASGGAGGGVVLLPRGA